MLLQTNSYIVPRDKRVEHARLLRRFRQTLIRLGCDHFEVYEQVGANWNTGETTGRFVQLMRFQDRQHQAEVQAAERTDPVAQSLIQEFCELINFPYQQQQGLFAVGFYVSFLRMNPVRQADEAEPGISGARGDSQGTGGNGSQSLAAMDADPAAEPLDVAQSMAGLDANGTWSGVPVGEEEVDAGEILGANEEANPPDHDPAARSADRV